MKGKVPKCEVVTGQDLVASLFPDIGAPPPEPTPPSPIESLWHWRRSPEPKYVRLRAELIPTKSSQPTDLIALATGNGFEEVSGPVAEVLRRLSHRSRIKPPRRATNIPTDRVLSHIWQHGRVARIFELSAKGTRPPPISVYEIRFAKERFFLIDDGHHRTEVCKMRHQEQVLALIRDVFVFDTSRWTLVRGGVRGATGELRTLPADERAAARWLGIRQR